MDPESRIKYYLGNLDNYNINININKYSPVLINDYSIITKNSTVDISQNAAYLYLTDLQKYITESKIPDDYKFMVLFGDVHDVAKKYTLTKTRPKNMTNNFNILVNLNYKYHWDSINTVKIHDIPYSKKNNKLIWRGASTNMKNMRKKLVDLFQNHPNKSIDIKFSHLCQGFENTNNYILDRVPIKDQLRSRFILCVEGNDVSTSLKWALYSNSCVLMPHPTMCSWLMEDKLVPYEHYVPIKDDFSDLEEKYNWCLKNLIKCKKIAENGKKYINNFLNEEIEAYIIKNVLMNYYNKVKFIEEQVVLD